MIPGKATKRFCSTLFSSAPLNRRPQHLRSCCASLAFGNSYPVRRRCHPSKPPILIPTSCSSLLWRLYDTPNGNKDPSKCMGLHWTLALLVLFIVPFATLMTGPLLRCQPPTGSNGGEARVIPSWRRRGSKLHATPLHWQAQ